MSRKVIALRGRGNSGKTTTMWRVHELFTGDRWEVTREIFNPDTGDFVDVLTKGKKKFGITSSGDDVTILTRQFGRMLDYNPPLVVCACRSWGQTNDFIDEHSNGRTIYIDKTVVDNPARERAANESDAQTLYARILSEII